MEWLSTAEPLLVDTAECLPMIRATAADIAAGRLHLSDDKHDMLQARRSGPLGRYFEALVIAAVASSPDVSIYFANVAVRDGVRSLGEFDLLFKAGGRWRHLEMAVKFYLGLGDLTDAYNWHGPNLRDKLGRKLDHLLEHQLSLPQTSAGQAVLRDLGISELSSASLVLGRLFYPCAEWQTTKTTQPAGIAANHPSGWWGTPSEVAALFGSGSFAWRLLQKPEWLAKSHELAAACNKMPEGLTDDVGGLSISQPVMCTQLERSDDGPFGERSRGFLVPDDWVARASAQGE